MKFSEFLATKEVEDISTLSADKQAELYFEVVPLVSKLANIESANLIKKEDESRFWHIFWGELGMVEDADVARAMDLFGASLNAFQGRVSNESCANQRKAISLEAREPRATTIPFISPYRRA